MKYELDITFVDYLVGLLWAYRDMPELRVCILKALDKVQPDTSQSCYPVQQPECEQ